jgi:hypothetical protein
MNRSNQKFICPICEKKITFSSLRVDSYISEIINTTKSETESSNSVFFNNDGTYSVVNKKRNNENSEDEDSNSNTKKQKIFLDLTI